MQDDETEISENSIVLEEEETLLSNDTNDKSFIRTSKELVATTPENENVAMTDIDKNCTSGTLCLDNKGDNESVKIEEIRESPNVTRNLVQKQLLQDDEKKIS